MNAASLAMGSTPSNSKRTHVRYLIKSQGSFATALVFVAGNALVAVACYLFIVGEIKRVELAKA